MKLNLRKSLDNCGPACLRVLTLLGLCFFFVSCQATGGTGVKVTSHHFQSGGKTIHVDRFRPDAVSEGSAPTAVLVLHGAGGVLLDGPEMKRVARALALAGHDAYVLHYFDRAGGPVTFDNGMTRHFDQWASTVRDAVTWMREEEGQKGGIGLFGYSLGGFLTVAEAFHDPRVAAAVVHAGGIWDGYERDVKQVPPMLLVHGRQDHRVEFHKYVPQLQSFVTNREGALQTSVYDTQGHRFDEKALVKVRAEAVAFFGSHLQPVKKRRATLLLKKRIADFMGTRGSHEIDLKKART